MRLMAHKVIVPCNEYDIEPKNVMRMMAVQKKDEDGNIIAPLNGLRLVLAANETNKHTNYAGLKTDSIEDCLNFAATMTKSGLNFKGDLSDCYHLFPLKPELWPYFCLQVPDHGTYSYVRLVQGWNRSAQIVTEDLEVIFSPIREYFRKYMDDVFVATHGTDEEFLLILKNFFDICLRYDLRLKGSKCVFLAKSTNYLGCEIKNGTGGPNPHRVLTLQQVEAKLLMTKGMLRTYMGTIGFVQRFMKRSSGVLGPLRKYMAGNPQELIGIDEKFVNEVEKVKRALGEMVATHPFNPKLPTVVVVDTSVNQTGGFNYQMDGKVPKFIAFYSRNRVDAERKTAINNVFYYMGIILNFNVIHMRNTEAKMMFSDGLSRITEILGLLVPQNECVGVPRCRVCVASNMLDKGTRISAVLERFFN